jgi:asparagine synthase (glutamine-hydrolysing)
LTAADLGELHSELVPEAAPGWTIEVDARVVGETPVLRIAADPGAETPAHASHEGSEVVFDGVLYDERKGAAFGAILTGQTAAQLVLGRYMCDGPAVLQTLKGSFALVMRGEDGTVHAARDPLGTWPLFYADAGSTVVFSTSVDALVRHRGVASDINRVMLAERLLGRWPCPGDDTYFEAVKRLAPGRALRISRGRRDVYRHSHPLGDVDVFHWTDVDQLGRLDEVIRQAVARCLQLGPSGIFLSGGVDSCTTAVAASDLCHESGRPTPIALSLLFPGSEEEPIQRGVAAQLGLTHVALAIEKAAGALGLLPTALATSRVWASPLLSPWQPGYQRLGLEARERGCRVLLTGDGGDQLLGADDRHAADLLRTRQFRNLYRFWSRASGVRKPGAAAKLTAILWLWKSAAAPIARRTSRETLRRGAPRLLNGLRARKVASMTPDWVAPDPELRRQLDRRAKARSVWREGASDKIADPLDVFELPQLWLGLEELFEIGRHMGVRLGQPFWDLDVVRLLAATPPDLLVQGGSKGPARDRLRARFPELGFDRSYQADSSLALRSILKAEGPAAWASLGGTPMLSGLGVVDGPKLGAMIELGFGDSQLRQAHLIWDVLVVESWLQGRMIGERR